MTSMQPRTADWTMLVALTLMWGSAFALTKTAVETISPEWVVAGRLAVGAALLVVVWALFSRVAPKGRRLWMFYVLIALIGNVVPFMLISWGQQTIDSSLAGILMAVMPLFTLVLARIAVPGERLTLTRVVGFAIGLLGVTMLLGPDALATNASDDHATLATLAVLGGAVCYAVSAVLTRLRPTSDATSSAAATTLLAAFMMAIVVRPSTGSTELLTASDAAQAAVVTLGVFSTALAAVLYFRLIERTGPAFVSQLNYLIPVWAVVLGVLLFDERPTTTDILAMLVILAGIMIAHSGEPRGRHPVSRSPALPRAAATRVGEET